MGKMRPHFIERVSKFIVRTVRCENIRLKYVCIGIPSRSKIFKSQIQGASYQTEPEILFIALEKN